ncbi:hypothetical protein IGI04_006164, partial [Brassica rapa subsp. trilocularis]
MGVTFKISKIGRKFRQRVSTESPAPESPGPLNPILSGKSKAIDAVQPSLPDISPDHEVSFVLSLYPNGYSVVNSSEVCPESLYLFVEAVQQASFRDAPKALHPYGMAAETLLSAIEAGRLPTDILEDIPCKFVDGAVICE